MKIESQKSGHVLQRYIMDRMSEIEGLNLPLMSLNRMDVFMDQEGSYWLCDTDINQDVDLEEQGCWKCREQFVMK